MSSFWILYLSLALAYALIGTALAIILVRPLARWIERRRLERRWRKLDIGKEIAAEWRNRGRGI